MSRTRSSLSSETLASASPTSWSCCWSSQRVNARSPPPPETVNARAWSATFRTLAATCAPPRPSRRRRASASSTNPAASIARRTSSASDRPRRWRCRSRSTRERLDDRRGLGDRRVAVVDAPAGGDAVGEQLVVGAAERARAQRRDDARRVGRVVDRAQQRDQLGDLRRAEERAARLGAVWDAARGQRVDVDARCPVRAGSRITQSRQRAGRVLAAWPGRATVHALAADGLVEHARRGARPPARGSRPPASAWPSPWTTTTGAPLTRRLRTARRAARRAAAGHPRSPVAERVGEDPVDPVEHARRPSGSSAGSASGPSASGPNFTSS